MEWCGQIQPTAKDGATGRHGGTASRTPVNLGSRLAGRPILRPAEVRRRGKPHRVRRWSPLLSRSPERPSHSARARRRHARARVRVQCRGKRGLLASFLAPLVQTAMGAQEK